MQPADVDEVRQALADHEYLADEGLATAIYLSIRLQRPLLLEGEAGVGKTEVAKVLSRWTGGRLLRLQCYEGIDVGQAVYEWDYSRQLLHLRAAESRGEDVENELYSERFLVRRPLLAAIAYGEGPPPVLLVDEVDRADDEFEAFLLEILSDYAVTVPELGTFTADVPPLVVVTSNRTRDVHDALKRRCLYHWVEHPDFEREVALGSVLAFTEALGAVGLEQRAGVYWAGRATLVSKPEDIAAYDQVFAAFWLGRERLTMSVPPQVEHVTLAVDDEDMSGADADD